MSDETATTTTSVPADASATTTANTSTVVKINFGLAFYERTHAASIAPEDVARRAKLNERHGASLTKALMDDEFHYDRDIEQYRDTRPEHAGTIHWTTTVCNPPTKKDGRTSALTLAQVRDMHDVKAFIRDRTDGNRAIGPGALVLPSVYTEAEIATRQNTKRRIGVDPHRVPGIDPKEAVKTVVLNEMVMISDRLHHISSGAASKVHPLMSTPPTDLSSPALENVLPRAYEMVGKRARLTTAEFAGKMALFVTSMPEKEGVLKRWPVPASMHNLSVEEWREIVPKPESIPTPHSFPARDAISIAIQAAKFAVLEVNKAHAEAHASMVSIIAEERGHRQTLMSEREIINEKLSNANALIETVKKERADEHERRVDAQHQLDAVTKEFEEFKRSVDEKKKEKKTKVAMNGGDDASAAAAPIAPTPKKTTKPRRKVPDDADDEATPSAPTPAVGKKKGGKRKATTTAADDGGVATDDELVHAIKKAITEEAASSPTFPSANGGDDDEDADTKAYMEDF